jgi:TRAP-type C4-dicarboxylate transport system substrate-binding protein
MRSKTLVLLAAVLSLLALPVWAQKQTLHMAYWAGPSHQMVQTLESWIKTVEEASGGNLTIELDKAAIGKMEGQYDLVKNGVRDLDWVVPGYTVGRFDILQAAELPLLCPNPTVCSPVIWKWYAKHNLAAKEFTDTTLLNIFVGGPFGIHTLKPIKTLEDVKALKIRAAGPSLPAARALGINAVPLPATETYEAVQRGTVDGSLFPWEAMTSFRINELVKGHLEIPGGLGAPVFVIVANTKAFENLTPANKAALMKASGEAGSALIGKGWTAADVKGLRDAKERGQSIETVTGAELERWRSLLKVVPEEWLKKVQQKGIDGRKLLDDLEGMIKSASS